MAWSNSGASIQVVDSVSTYCSALEPQNLPITSTSTILLDVDGSYSLRVYMNLYDDFRSSMRLASTDYERYSPSETVVKPCPADSSWTERFPTSKKHILYLDSSSLTLPIVVDIGLPSQLFETCIPTEVDEAAVTYAVLTQLSDLSASPPVEGAWEYETRYLFAQYKDPSVVAVPSDYVSSKGFTGWIMVVARYLVPRTEGSSFDEPAEGDAAMSPIPDTSFAQIVAWWSDTPDFTGKNTIGPFLLVDGANAWEDGEYVRLWLGTPGVAILPSDSEQGAYDLFVYYSADPTIRGYFGPDYETLTDLVKQSAYSRALSRAGFQPGVGCKRISLKTLMDAVDYEKTNEKSDDRFRHTDTDVWNPSSALEGTLLGGVRIWLPEGRRRGLGHSVRSFFADYDWRYLRFADPAPTLCGTETDSLSLYLAINQRDLPYGTVAMDPYPATLSELGSGHGLWRGRAISDGTVLAYSATVLGETHTYRIVATFGKDFLCATQDSVANISPDQLMESKNYASYNPVIADTGTPMPTMHIWIDPDPVLLDDGTVRVSGGAAVPSGGSALGDYTAYVGDAATACESARALFELETRMHEFPGRDDIHPVILV